MRVLLTTDTLGGVWTFTRDLCESLLMRGHAACLVSFGGEPSADQGTWTEALRAQYPERFVFEASRAPLEWMQTNASCWRNGSADLQTAIDQFRPDVLHLSQFCFGALPTQVPKVITAHSDVLSWAQSCRPHGLESSAWLDTYCSLVAGGLQGADAVVAPTRWMLHALESNFTTAATMKRVISNGRSTGMLTGQVEGMQAVTVGRLWDEAKGIDSVLSVAWPIPLYIAGEQRFDSASAPRHEDTNVHWLGRLSPEGVVSLLQRSSIYVGPSRYEPFGLAPLEAALCGCALVLRDLPSFREVWSDSALYFASEGELQHVVSELSHDEVYLRTMQEAASQHATWYSVDRMTAAYLELYREALSARRNAELAAHAA